MIRSPGFHPGHDGIVINKLIRASRIGLNHGLFDFLFLPLIIIQ